MRVKAEARREARRASREKSEQIRNRLERRGISHDFAREVSAQLEPFVDDLSGDSLEAVYSGVALAYGAHRRAVEAFRRTTAELEEIQTLIGSFSLELRKLDEALEILAAYAARLRHHTAPAPERLLH